MAARARLVHENSTRGAGDGAVGPLAGAPGAKVRRTHTGAAGSRAKARRTHTGSADLPASSLWLGDLVDPQAWGDKHHPPSQVPPDAVAVCRSCSLAKAFS
eukprot:7535846-Heterocapsa_arctica.AAC.1